MEQYEVPCLQDRWKTASEIVCESGKSRHWAYAKLRDWGHVCYEVRGDRGGKPLRHFPPCVVALIVAEANRVLPRKTWLTRHEICKLLGITWRIAEKLLSDFKDKARVRRDKKNRERLHYPPYVVKQLRVLVNTAG